MNDVAAARTSITPYCAPGQRSAERVLHLRYGFGWNDALTGLFVAEEKCVSHGVLPIV